ncbi:DUF4926 domain-containing protein [Cerasicoccus fimbriatus]|uniref:DUF4926 domain-containing protein n=1 Tax=Cerasicoccus fimbriatus TaxID=3014554 RepID=UPI0022B3A119|nr:DUF4926 domain-containing protein [Cerasicoccus sp. TK19100]
MMPFGKCPVCDLHYHIRPDDPLNWHRNHGLEIGEPLISECYFCWKELSEYDAVKVISLPEDCPQAVEIGDTGTVLISHNSDPENLAFEVECVNENGSTKWLATLYRFNLHYVFPPKVS